MTHPLLAPRAPLPGFIRYVYTHADLVEILRAVWLPATDKATVVKEILAVTKAGDELYAVMGEITRVVRAVAPAVAPVAAVRAAPAPSRSAWCVRCGGPVCDGGRFCGEC